MIEVIEKVTNRKVVVLRAGIVTKETIREGAEKVDTRDKVYGLSVQITPGTAKQDQKTVNELLKPIPHKHYALTFAGNIMDKGGIIEYNPIEGNKLHGLVSNITVDDLYDIFKINKHLADLEEESGSAKKLNIKLEKQINANNCWAAALSMALQVFGIKKSQKELDLMFHAQGRGLNLDEVNDEFPQNFPNLKTIYKSRIFTHQSPVLTFSQIKAFIDNDNPILIGVNEFKGHAAHALLIFGYNEAKESVWIADPWTGKAEEYKYASLKNFTWSETMVIQKK